MVNLPVRLRLGEWATSTKLWLAAVNFMAGRPSILDPGGAGGHAVVSMAAPVGQGIALPFVDIPLAADPRLGGLVGGRRGGENGGGRMVIARTRTSFFRRDFMTVPFVVAVRYTHTSPPIFPPGA